MSILNFKRKEKKITVKFFLRKDQGEVNVPYTHHPDIVYYPLYIDFIHRRKKSKCKSLFLKFHDKGTNVQNISHVYFNEFGVATREFTDDIEKRINDESPQDRSYQFDLLDLLICEKQHAVNLFKLFSEISDENFSLSNLSEGYHYSLRKRAYELYDEVLKELLLKEFHELVPTYPIESLEIILASYTYYDFFELLVKLFNLTAIDARIEIRSYRLMDLGFSLTYIGKMIHSYMTIKPNTSIVLTVPTWVVEEHSKKLNLFLKSSMCISEPFKNKDSLGLLVDIVLYKAEEKLNDEVCKIRSYFGGTAQYY